MIGLSSQLVANSLGLKEIGDLREIPGAYTPKLVRAPEIERFGSGRRGHTAQAFSRQRSTIEEAAMTTLLPVSAPLGAMTVPSDVYVPQQDSQMIVDTVARMPEVVRGRAADLCTGSGVLAIAIAKAGASEVVAFDISTSAVRAARANARAARATVEVRHGSFEHAWVRGAYDLVVCNPPYVPAPQRDDEPIPDEAGPAAAWNAGADGRLVLDPLCRRAPDLLAPGGTLLLVHSEFSGVEDSLSSLRSGGLTAEVVASQEIPFGPVLTARARWLERTGRLQPGRRTERLVVIRADKS
jgi:release factor glutamine methyltransferase